MQIMPDYTGSSSASGVWKFLTSLWDALCERVLAIFNKIFCGNSLESQQKAPSLEGRVEPLSPTSVASSQVFGELDSTASESEPSSEGEEGLKEEEVETFSGGEEVEDSSSADFAEAEMRHPLIDSTVYVAEKAVSLVQFLASSAFSGLGYLGRAAGVLSSPVEPVQVQVVEESQAVSMLAPADPIAEQPAAPEQPVQAQPAPVAVAVAAEPSLDFDVISAAQVEAFGDLLPTLHSYLGTFKQAGLLSHKSRLEARGVILQSLHPLVYLGYALNRWQEEFAGIFKHSCTTGAQFRAKTIEALSAHKDTIIPHVEEFAQAIGKPQLSERLQAHARQSKWQDFITLCIL